MQPRHLICPDLRQIEVENFDLDPLPDDGILVENEYTAISVGTEIWGFLHGCEPGGEPRFPRKTGYCSTGLVLEVGKDIADVKPGDRVAGHGNHASHGVLRQYHKVLEGVSPKSASLLTMTAIAMHGIRVAKIELGEAVAVIGLGLVGQLSLSLARLSGATPVIAVDLDDFRLTKARARDADLCINPGTVDDVPAAVRSICFEDGANVVLECTGKPAAYPMAIKLPCMAGRFVAVGSPRGTVEFDFFTEVHLREVTMLGALQPRTPEQEHIYFWWTKDRERTLLLSLMADGRLSVEDLITSVEKPESCQKVYDMLADDPQNTLGVLFEW